MTSDLSRLRSDVLKQWSADAWDALIETLQARLAPLEEQLGVQRAVTDAIVGRGLAVIEAELAPLVAQGSDVLGDINVVKGNADVVYAALLAMVQTGIPMANITGLAAALEAKAPSENPELTGTPTAPTAAAGTSSSQIASTAFVQAAVTALKASPALTGTPTAPTAPAGTSSTQIASTAFVQAAIAALINAAPGTLDTLGELAAALGDDSNFAATVSGALAQRLRVDAAQGLTDAQQGQARANMGAGVLSGFRNKIINGDFLFSQAGASHTTSGYGSADMWASYNVGTTKTTSVQAFPIGQTEVPGNPRNFLRTVVNSVAGSANLCQIVNATENVLELSGKRVTLTFWAKADSPKNIAIEVVQFFGTGGAPSANVTGIGGQLVALTSSWARKSFVIDIPSVFGKTLGTSPNTSGTAFQFWLDAGASLNARTSGLGQQSGTFDIAHVSVVEGDATGEADPFSPRHISQEFNLCSRYYWRPGQAYELRGYASSSSDLIYCPINTPPMRVAPTILKLNEVLGGNTSALNFSASAGGGGYMQLNGLAAGPLSGAAIPVLDARI